MKYLWTVLAVIALVSLNSCEVSEDGLRVSYDVVAIDSVQVPATFDFGNTYDIPVYYQRPSDCHVFEGFNVNAELNIRNISAVLAEFEAGDCTVESVTEEQNIKFKAASNGTYVFRFFSGIDANGNETYIERTVSVLE